MTGDFINISHKQCYIWKYTYHDSVLRNYYELTQNFSRLIFHYTNQISVIVELHANKI